MTMTLQVSLKISQHVEFAMPNRWATLRCPEPVADIHSVTDRRSSTGMHLKEFTTLSIARYNS